MSGYAYVNGRVKRYRTSQLSSAKSDCLRYSNCRGVTCSSRTGYCELRAGPRTGSTSHETTYVKPTASETAEAEVGYSEPVETPTHLPHETITPGYGFFVFVAGTLVGLFLHYELIENSSHLKASFLEEET